VSKNAELYIHFSSLIPTQLLLSTLISLPKVTPFLYFLELKDILRGLLQLLQYTQEGLHY